MLRILIHDVGHGQAIHIFTPSKKVIVIDLGCSSDYSPIEWLRRQTNIIDYLIISHPHGDHIDEILEIEEYDFKVRQLNRPKHLDKKTVYAQNQTSYKDKLNRYFEMSDSYNMPIADNERVGNPNVNGGVSIKTYYSKECGVSNINNHSAVVVIDYEGYTIIIPGDNEPASWKELMENKEFIAAMNRVDVFVASHHGRKSGYCNDIFISKPKLCIVSDGRVQDTDVTSRYSHHAMGLKVYSRNSKSSSVRNCLTTRTDGYIEINASSTSLNVKHN